MAEERGGGGVVHLIVNRELSYEPVINIPNHLTLYQLKLILFSDVEQVTSLNRAEAVRDPEAHRKGVQ